MKHITPNIVLEDCEPAMDFYRNIFGGEVKDYMKTPENKVMHAELIINANCKLYFNDSFAGRPEGDNITLMLEMDSEEEINRVYKALQEGGKVHYELQKTFWGAYHGVIIDKYGITWGVNYMIPT